jgi:GntP family gluconate:H+ symporter
MVSNGTLDPAFTAAAIGAGALGIIHVNSSFFWLFKEVHDLPVVKLLKTFSVLSAISALAGGLLLILIYLFSGS